MSIAKSLFELADRWDKDGELGEEFQILYGILPTTLFTRGQVQACFEQLIGPICFLAYGEAQQIPTIDQFRSQFREYMKDTTQTVESCMELLEIEKRPERESLVNALRQRQNADWLESLKDEEPPSEKTIETD